MVWVWGQGYLISWPMTGKQISRNRFKNCHDFFQLHWLKQWCKNAYTSALSLWNRAHTHTEWFYYLFLLFPAAPQFEWWNIPETETAREVDHSQYCAIRRQTHLEHAILNKHTRSIRHYTSYSEFLEEWNWALAFICHHISPERLYIETNIE